MQQGLLFHSALERTSAAYVNQVSVTLDDLPLAEFKAAWQAAVARHPVLRAAFLSLPGAPAPVQLIRRDLTLPIRELDWRRQAPMTLDALVPAGAGAAF